MGSDAAWLGAAAVAAGAAAAGDGVCAGVAAAATVASSALAGATSSASRARATSVSSSTSSLTAGLSRMAAFNAGAFSSASSALTAASAGAFAGGTGQRSNADNVRCSSKSSILSGELLGVGLVQRRPRLAAALRNSHCTGSGRHPPANISLSSSSGRSPGSPAASSSSEQDSIFVEGRGVEEGCGRGAAAPTLLKRRVAPPRAIVRRNGALSASCWRLRRGWRARAYWGWDSKSRFVFFGGA